MLEVVDFQKKRRAQLVTPGAAVKQFTIGSCLPALVVCFRFDISFLGTPQFFFVDASYEGLTHVYLFCCSYEDCVCGPS